MKDGFIKVAAATPQIRVADPEYNANQIMVMIDHAVTAEAKIVVFPELCLTGYTCGDLFLQDRLLKTAREQLLRIVRDTEKKSEDTVCFIGLPIEMDGKLYNAAAAVQRGKILAIIPKKNIPTYGEFYEMRHFTPGNESAVPFQIGENIVPFGMNILIDLGEAVEGLKIGCEICEDVWVPEAPNISHALHGATLLVNLSASNETVGKDSYRKQLIASTSARLVAGYIYCSAGDGESTQDIVFGGHNIIAENGTVLGEQKLFENGITVADIDIERIRHERRKMTTFQTKNDDNVIYSSIKAHMKSVQTNLTRKFAAKPFVPSDAKERAKRCEQILSIQSNGLKKRFAHTGCKSAVIGVSGGLDSTLALLVTVRAFDMLGLSRQGIIAVTMPCFGTTDRTYNNACKLARKLGATLKEINIRMAVTVHFSDIEQDMEKHDVTYENGQARERTQVLMDLANQQGGMVIGTGDMSELALGWATYNGDHMSMYGVNVGVPKTLVRHLVQYYADSCNDQELAEVLLDILDTPVSPELIPPVEGKISQKTEDLVGPYELHDFFLYYMLRFGFSPAKIYRIAVLTFEGVYEAEIIKKWLKIFIRRFFTQQFKRSCLPDGPKVGSVAVSPRGDLRMPSDASARLWMEEAEKL
ncbi:MAG: NAD(+) synthase [Butyrivibrio sp.]|nr:NAD(+) synthase [Butyrivibrio sp.]